MNLTSALKKEYEHLWNTCQVRPQRRAAAREIADRIVRSRRRYEAAGTPHGVPWYVVGIIHQLEGGGNFKTHLHNGDPLTARTVHEPAGRPPTGHPPFTWEFSATDALVSDGLGSWRDWSIPGTLFVFERFNGFGYRSPSIAINSPYLWSFSNHYTKGKFDRDRHYSPTTVSAQLGAAVLLRELANRGLVPGGVLERGDRDPAVLALKRDLKTWFTANVPGEWARLGIVDNDRFAAGLEKAVKIFQAQKGLPASGKVDKATRTALAAALARSAATGAKVLKRGERGPAVKKLKRDLRAWFEATSPGEWARFGVADTDVFGAALEKAVKVFQRRNHLAPNGTVGKKTRDTLAAGVHA
jgi:lysozyme family protein